ncbi:MAG: DUF1295 domain-containing protein [Clostridia bacterium]|nr:DUF1295 domain-containing protein [Clostridia bacterium]
MESIKQSRVKSFIAAALIYLVAACAGAALYLALPFPFWLSLLVADIASTVVVFAFSLIFKNASVYDPYWSVQPMVILVLFSVVDGVRFVNLLPLAAVCFWGLRLTANWAYSFRGFKHEDWRYVMLRERSGKLYPLVNFFGIHLVPTLIVYACTLPAVFLYKEEAYFRPICAIFFLVSAGAAVLQLVSDIQMHRHHAQGSRSLLRKGLWKYSRHPNYLGEILMWWGIGLYSVFALLDRWYLLAGALLNTLLFVFVSIPMMDDRQSKKRGYADYKRRTRMLLPIKKTVKK